MEFSTVIEDDEEYQEESEDTLEEDNEGGPEPVDNVANNAKRISSKFKYGFEIKRSDDIQIGFSKCYGSMYGGIQHAETPEEAIKKMQGIIKDWEDFDSIAQRKGDKVRKDNLYFKTDVPEVSINKLFNEHSLTEWFK